MSESFESKGAVSPLPLRQALLSASLRSSLRRLEAWRWLPSRLLVRLLWWPARLTGPRYFRLDGRRFRYFVHPLTLDTERIAEIAVARDFVETGVGDLLEVGNVLGVFFRTAHRVVDKYEVLLGVKNLDVIDLLSDGAARFDRIVCVSTLEHVGLDEKPRSLRKALDALTVLHTLLRPGGEGLVTFPSGVHELLDEWAQLPPAWANVRFLKRDSRFNVWSEVASAEAAKARYGHPYPCANVLTVVRISPVGSSH